MLSQLEACRGIIKWSLETLRTVIPGPWQFLQGVCGASPTSATLLTPCLALPSPAPTPHHPSLRTPTPLPPPIPHSPPHLLGPCLVLIPLPPPSIPVSTQGTVLSGPGAAASPWTASRGRAAWRTPGPQRLTAQDPVRPVWAACPGGPGSQREPGRLSLPAWTLESRGRSERAAFQAVVAHV